MKNFQEGQTSLFFLMNIQPMRMGTPRGYLNCYTMSLLRPKERQYHIISYIQYNNILLL